MITELQQEALSKVINFFCENIDIQELLYKEQGPDLITHLINLEHSVKEVKDEESIKCKAGGDSGR